MIHAAADTNHGAATLAQREANVDGTRAVFAAAGRAGVSRAVHVSTGSVLFDGRPLVNAKERHSIPRKAAGGNSCTKAEGEKIALSHAGPGLCVSVVRPRFVWGADDTTALPQLAAAVRSGHFAWVAGGRYLTSTTHIDNLCVGIQLALESGACGETYSITDGDPVEFRIFATELLATQGLVSPVRNVARPLLRAIASVGDLISGLTGRAMPINLQTYATSTVEVTLDITKAREDLGYVPLTIRQEGPDALRRAAS